MTAHTGNPLPALARVLEARRRRSRCTQCGGTLIHIRDQEKRDWARCIDCNAQMPISPTFTKKTNSENSCSGI